MQRKDIDTHVDDAVSCPVLAKRLQKVVLEIEETALEDKTKQMMYELVDIVLQMGQRVRALERHQVSRSGPSDVSLENMEQPKREMDLRVDFPEANEKPEHRTDRSIESMKRRPR